MTTVISRWKRIRATLAKIHIVDRFLIVFMILLMLQSTHNLFANHTSTGESANIDIIVRTSSAAIFGYFLSTNFICRALKGGANGSGGARAKDIPAKSSSGIQSRIGFAPPDSGEAADMPDTGRAAYSESIGSDEFGASTLQIIITSVIGLYCLVVLIIARDISVLNTDMAVSATASASGAQFRDIVSGCIGFLIGCPTANANQQK